MPEGETSRYLYRRDVLDQLIRHGARPTENTRPELVHEYVSDLYRHELRRLRARLLRKDFPKSEYFGRVVELRTRYLVISLKPAEWIE